MRVIGVRKCEGRRVRSNGDQRSALPLWNHAARPGHTMDTLRLILTNGLLTEIIYVLDCNYPSPKYI